MSIVPPTPHAPPPNCPVCGRPAASESIVTRDGVATGNYLCAAEHIWLTKWPEGARV